MYRLLNINSLRGRLYNNANAIDCLPFDDIDLLLINKKDLESSKFYTIKKYFKPTKKRNYITRIAFTIHIETYKKFGTNLHLVVFS